MHLLKLPAPDFYAGLYFVINSRICEAKFKKVFYNHAYLVEIVARFKYNGWQKNEEKSSGMKCFLFLQKDKHQNTSIKKGCKAGKQLGIAALQPRARC